MPIHVVEPVGMGRDDFEPALVGGRQVEPFVAAGTERHRVAERFGLAWLGIAVERRGVVRPQAEEQAAPDFAKRQATEEPHGLGEDLLGFAGPRLAGAAVLVLPAIVLEKMEADVPGKVDAMAVREKPRLGEVQRVIGLVAET